MKVRVLTLVALLALAATPALAYVSSGSFMSTNDRSPASMPNYGYSEVGENYSGINFDPTVSPFTPLRQRHCEPVPEPGTMAMASMGLLALGASLRRRLGR